MGKPVAWDVTVPDTYANTYIAETATTTSTAANRAAENKTSKYQELAKNHQFAPIAIETGGGWNEKAVSRVHLRSGTENHLGNQGARGDHVPVSEDIL